MKNKLKVRTPILALILFVLTAGQAFAADKVAVIPLMGGDVSAQEFNNQHVWSGLVTTLGQKWIAGWYTSSKTGTGTYRVILQAAHLKINIAEIGSNCIPVATASVAYGSNGDTVRVTNASCIADGPLVDSLALTFTTADSADIAADKSFSFLAKMQDSNLPAPAASLSSAESSLPEGVKCETVGDITTCTMGEIE